MSDPWQDPGTQAWVRDVLDELIPKIDSSEVIVSLVPTGPTDVKFAVETGLAIMMDKPIILAVVPGRKIPAKLQRVADAIVEFDPEHPERTSERIQRAMKTLSEGDEA